MNIKQVARKMSALAAGATMLGATVMGAMAYTLADYPGQWVSDGAFNGKIVIGTTAQPADLLGAVDIATSLQSVSKSPVSAGGGVEVAGGESEEVAPDTLLQSAFGTSLDDNDVAALKSGSVDIDIGGESDTYDYHEAIYFTSGAVLETGASAANPDEDFQENVFLLLSRGSIEYRFVFEDTLNTDNFIANASEDDPITLDFLGRTLEITGATNTSITVQVGEEVFLSAGQEVTIDGKKVKLNTVSNTKALISVGGQQVDLTEGQTKTVGGLKVKLDSIFNDDGVENDGALIIVGDEATKTYSDGDEWIGEDEDDPNWVWDLTGLSTDSPTLAVEWDQTIDDPSDDPIMVGGAFALPGEYVTIALDSFNQADSQQYTVSQQTGESLYNAAGTVEMVTSADVLLFSTDGGNEDGFLTATAEESDEIAVWWNTSITDYQVFYKDHDDANKFKLANTLNSTGFYITFQDTTYTVTFTNVTQTTGNWTVDEPAGSDWKFWTQLASNEFQYLGHSDGDTTTGADVIYGTVDISGWEESTRTPAGTVIESYDGSASSDEINFWVPEDAVDFKVNVLIAGDASAVSSGSGAYMVNQLPVGLAVLDADAEGLLGSENLIVVGGPYVNTIAAELMGNPTGEEIMQMFQPGRAKIKLYEDQNAILVAGYNAQDTVGASYVLAKYSEYADELVGDEVEVVVPSLSQISVTTPTLPSTPGA